MRCSAAKPGALIVHEELQPAGTFADLKHLKGKKNNIESPRRAGAPRRDIEHAASRRPIAIFEDTFKSGQVMHTPLEPMVSVAETRRQ